MHVAINTNINNMTIGCKCVMPLHICFHFLLRCHNSSASPMPCYHLVIYSIYEYGKSESFLLICTISDMPILNKICLHHWDTKEYTRRVVFFLSFPFLCIQNLDCSNWIDLYRIFRQKKLPHKMTNLQCRQKSFD